MRRAGVIGINHRNSRYTLRCNPRRLYPLVDDKLRTKRLCQEAGIPTPKLLAVATHQHAVQALPRKLAAYDKFVLKPARGAMGNGILVLTGRRDGKFLRSGGRPLDVTDLVYHAAQIVRALHRRHPDAPMAESYLHPPCARRGLDRRRPRHRVVYRGIPVMAMTGSRPSSRAAAPTSISAVGVGIDLVSGMTTRHARQLADPTSSDSRALLISRPIPPSISPWKWPCARPTGRASATSVPTS
jgi:hypothetical protein